MSKKVYICFVERTKIFIMQELISRHLKTIEDVDLGFNRYLLKQLPWNEKLVGIKGARGVGKTTMLLQYLKQNYGASSKAMYVSLDNLYFSDNRLLDFVDDFVARGGEHLFIDEVHKYRNWAVELKNIYDYHKELKVVFTGSSLLEILNSRADLSRRALVYNMQGLSFREFLALRYGIETDVFTLNDIIANHTKIAMRISKQIKPLKYFDEYLRTGYFPFYSNSEVLYYKRLQEIINMILEIELPLLRNTDISIVNKMKQLLYVVSQSVPFKPNITALASKIQVTRKTVLDYVNYLQDAGIFNLIHKNSVGIGLLQKPEKLYLENTNYMYAIKADTPNIGSVRETFFLNQLSVNHTITYPERGDFLVDGKYLFEVGGKQKDFKQISDIDNSFIAAADIEFGVGNKIPLWLFGLLY